MTRLLRQPHNSGKPHWSITPFSTLGKYLLLAVACQISTICIGADEASSGASRVESLQVVDCLLPGMVRRLGNAQYLTPRLPVRTTAADCGIRGGEYTAYDRADYKTALAVWMPAAEAGDAEAQANVGEIFERGLGGEPNYEAAVIWYEKAAKQSNSRAQFNLGTLYEQGLGVPKDRLKALNLYRDAWGMPADSLIYESAANQETEELRAELSKAVDQRDVRIRKLEQDLADLQKQKQKQVQASGATDQAALQKEIEDLRLWIDSLESERSKSIAQLDTLPKTREPQASVRTPKAPTSGRDIKSGKLDFGRYFALIIGNQDYSNIEHLDTPQNDAQAVAEVLQRKYGFSVEVLLNADNITLMEKINDLSESLGENDNLLIYYAGHGSRIQVGDVQSGYWLPVNADPPPRNTFWVSTEFVTGHLGRIKARRVLVMADSCYAGLLSDAPGFLMLQDGPEYNEEFMRYKLPKRSRLLLSSGGDEPVLDSGAPGHSVFASVLLDTLNNNQGIISGPQLFAAMKDKVSQRSAAMGMTQEPEFKVIKGAGHEVGDFFFVPI
jgi:uncharacterized protein